MEKLAFKSIEFRDCTTGDHFPITTQMRVAFIGHFAPQLTNGTVSGENSYEITPDTKMRVGDFFGVKDDTQDVETYWIAEVVPAPRR